MALEILISHGVADVNSPLTYSDVNVKEVGSCFDGGMPLEPSAAGQSSSSMLYA